LYSFITNYKSFQFFGALREEYKKKNKKVFFPSLIKCYKTLLKKKTRIKQIILSIYIHICLQVSTYINIFKAVIRRAFINIILIWIVFILSKTIIVYIFDLDISFMHLVFSLSPFFLVCVIFSFIKNKSRSKFAIILLIVTLGMAYFGYTPLIDTSIFHMDFHMNFNQAPRFYYNNVIGYATDRQLNSNTLRLLQDAVTPGARNRIDYPVYTSDNQLYRSVLAQTFEKYFFTGPSGPEHHPYVPFELLSPRGEAFFMEYLRQHEPSKYGDFLRGNLRITDTLIENIRKV